jgi:hypothetical protein
MSRRNTAQKNDGTESASSQAEDSLRERFASSKSSVVRAALKARDEYLNSGGRTLDAEGIRREVRDRRGGLDGEN